MPFFKATVERIIATLPDITKASIFISFSYSLSYYINQEVCSFQWRNEVRWRPGQEESLAPPCSNLWAFGSKYIALKKILVTLLRFFGVPCSHSAPPQWLGAQGIVPPLLFLVTLLVHSSVYSPASLRKKKIIFFIFFYKKVFLNVSSSETDAVGLNLCFLVVTLIFYDIIKHNPA